MSKKHCKDCQRFDHPRREGELGYCTQCGEDTSADGDACHWFAPLGNADEEKEEKED